MYSWRVLNLNGHLFVVDLDFPRVKVTCNTQRSLVAYIDCVNDLQWCFHCSGLIVIVVDVDSYLRFSRNHR